jgi:hypothetical protein
VPAATTTTEHHQMIHLHARRQPGEDDTPLLPLI